MHRLAKLDHQYIWHPFTQMRDWLQCEPIVIARGKGAVLEDVHGRKYLDANSSIWTNLHGHNHPKINAAIKRQLRCVAHSSSLGLANEPASLLAKELAQAANLHKVFFSDDGSTAMEVALKLSYEFSHRRGLKPKFLSLDGAYHGDTVGAVSLGHIDLFHKSFGGLLFDADKVMAPYCYRCPFNRARPERADAREYRKCNWECVGKVEQKFRRHSYSAFVVEPLIQGAAGMIAQPTGWLRRMAEITRAHGAHLIADEVLTGFGRTGTLFACEQEGVRPDFLALSKGLTGGYLPMAATLT
ncbi:MAG TPA: aminotransferase class III-fold pyridoxal phosphate-dependent enzyme, partial [Verrucomicrobiae bacterium]|nr:aminotransferase class III-fold pyridoxal phosphate-dependent enzyme [Verrucomicrobiae bacterium]